MREIKFKVWDKKKKEMWGEVEIDAVFDEGYWPCPDPKDVIFLQFTGLKDKNGKEIYEGDIVEYIHYEDSFLGGKSKIKKEVKWNTYYGASWNFGIAYKDGEKRWSYPVPYEIEVIGNIYENPNLLTHKPI